MIQKIQVEQAVRKTILVISNNANAVIKYVCKTSNGTWGIDKNTDKYCW